MGEWGTYVNADETGLHMIRNGDVGNHHLEPDCWCGPAVAQEFETGAPVFLHRTTGVNDKALDA